MISDLPREYAISELSQLLVLSDSERAELERALIQRGVVIQLGCSNSALVRQYWQAVVDRVQLRSDAQQAAT
jgi:hypothetical protein